MADDGILLVARLDEVKSKNNIQEQLNRIQKQLQLQISNTRITKAGVTNLQHSIDTIQKNLNLNIGNVSIDQNKVTQQAQTISTQLSNAINVAMQGSGTTLRAFNSIDTIKAALNQKMTFGSLDELSATMKSLLPNFKGVTTAITEWNNDIGKVEAFRVEVKNVDGVVENLTFHLKELEGEQGRAWQLRSATASDNSVRILEQDIRKVNTEFKTLSHNWQIMENLSNRSIFSKNASADEVVKIQQSIAEADKKFAHLKAQFDANPLNTGLLSQIQALNSEILSTNQNANKLARSLAQSQTNVNPEVELNNLKTLMNNLKASDVEVEKLKADYGELIGLFTQAKETGNFTTFFTQLEVFKSKFAEAKSEVRATNTEIVDLVKMAKTLQSNKLNNFFNKNQGNIKTDALRAKINTLVNEWNTLNAEIQNTGKITPSLQARLDELRTKMETASKSAETLQKEIKSVADAQKLAAQKQSLSTRITSWLQNNTAASQETKAALMQLQAQIQSADAQTMQNLNAELRRITSSAREAGQAGMKFGDIIKNKLAKFTGWFSIATVVMRGVNTLKKMYQEVVELDTALVDLRKTTDGTNAELEQFYIDANKIGKDLGVTTKEVIQAASSWSRLGYSLKDAQEMAKTSSIFASISPDMNIDQATDGLVSAMKAFNISANDALDGIASKVNIIGNTQAVSNENIVEFLTRSSAAMAEANNSLEETIALGTAITEITRDATNAGQVMKTMSMRIRGIDEETEEYSEDIAMLTGKIADLTKTAKTPGGISLFTDATRSTYKSTVQILREIDGIYDDLTDKQQAELLEILGGKRNGQAVAAALNNFGTVEKSLDSIANSAGNAEAEMSVIIDSIEYKTNRLKETAVGIAQDIFQRDSTKRMVDNLTSLLEVINSLTKSIGGLGTAFTAFMAYKGFKNVGRTKMFVLDNRICRQ